MKKLFTCLCVLTLTAAVAAAEVVHIENFARGSAPVLIPAVQRYDAREGVFALPDTLTVSVPSGEELIVEQLASEMARFGKTAAAGENAAVPLPAMAAPTL